MGIAFSAIKRMDDLGLFHQEDISVLDIGSSNLYLATAEDIKWFLRKYAPSSIADVEEFAARLAAGSAYDPVTGGRNEAFVGELFEKAGMKYESLDIASGYRTTVLDLNCATLPSALRRRFDLVLNFGTTEHILNQFNCFNVIHDAAKVGGYIYHSLPAVGYVDHGYITYTARCFFDLAGYNGYEIMDFWFDGPSGRNDLYEGVRNYSKYFPALGNALSEIRESACGKVLSELAIPDVSINIIYRKVKDKPFWGALEASTSVGKIPDAVTAGYSDSGNTARPTPPTTASPESPVRRLSRALERYPTLHRIARRIYRAFCLWTSRFGGKGVPEEKRLKKPLAETPADILPAPELKPGIFIVTLPKSGSVFIQAAINQTTGLAPMVPSHGYFPTDMLNVDSIVKFAQGGHVAHSHCDPSEFNLRVLDFFAIDWVLHLRDPRAALLSWTHHNERQDIRHNPSGHLRSSPPHPDGYFDFPFAAKLDWQIEFWLPGMIRWIERWCDVVDSPNYQRRILLTTYEGMHGRDQEFVGDLIKRFHGTRPEKISLPARDITSHFRTGRRDEWREVFSAEQIERATAAIGPRLRERFGWDA